MTLGRELTEYEAEVVDTMRARRDAALHLMEVLAEDVADYDEFRAAVERGDAMSILEPPNSGRIRQAVSEAVIEFEAARHRFRLALVAVAVDNGMHAREIGDSFAFSRQLASRYLKEARDKWPGLAARETEAPARAGGPTEGHAGGDAPRAGSDASRGVFAY